MTLEEAWKLLEFLNEDANRQSKNVWASNDVEAAIQNQAQCFRKNVLELDNKSQQFIDHWAKCDDEFRDYLRCLSNNMIIDAVSKG